jgi:lipoprotein-anchoring transpeptidase ErfK/SrfK
MPPRPFATLCALLLAVAGCDGSDPSIAESDPVAPEPDRVALTSDWDARLAREELERGRLDASWSRVVELDTLGIHPDSTANQEVWDSITPQSVNTGAMQLPLYGAVEGPSVLRTQILLDRAFFSPGIIDGHWGKNTEKAIYWFQHREGLRKSGRLDSETFDRLIQISGGSAELVRTHQLTAEDVEGPFVTVPEDIYDKAELECLCYESIAERLAETFHTSVEILQQLNPGVDLSTVVAGSTLQVPAVRDPNAGRDRQVARLVISGEGFYLQALDANGAILFHFPSTLGSTFDPSPEGDHRVTRITPDPWWHYQPSILEHVADEEEEAQIPPGPNNAVGVVWMALSIPHYGIHGTSAPETIGYTTSAGCVRLTNWDATFLSQRIAEGIPVEFQATR